MNEQKKTDAEAMAKAIEQLRENNKAYLRGRIEGEAEAVAYMRAKLESEKERSA
jgi:hypothetical protein